MPGSARLSQLTRFIENRNRTKWLSATQHMLLRNVSVLLLYRGMAFFCTLGALTKRFANLNVIQQTKKFSNHWVQRSASKSTDALVWTEETDASINNRQLTPIRPPLPIVTSRFLQFQPKYSVPRQAWLENIDTVEEVKLGIVDLHPKVFAAQPRLDFLHANVRWQRNYRRVRFTKTKSRAEVRGGGRKPWPQKGTGRARHGSIRSPIFKGGGVAHGPRGAKSYFYMLPFWVRVKGLTTALSVKLAQDDLHIVDDLEIPTNDPKFLEKLVEERNWGLSILFVDDTDIMPENITQATNTVGHYNLMPVYGLNVYSMLKHETVVLTLAALNRIEERILFHMNKLDITCTKAFKRQNI